MTFSEALEELKSGKKIKRAHWCGYWFIDDKVVISEDNESIDSPMFEAKMIIAKLKDNAGFAPAQAYQNDLLSEDWEVVE
jgi:hypothetical protein